MRFMLLILSLALSSPAAFAAKKALPSPHLFCATGMPTTAFELSAEGDQYVVRVKHVNGVDFMPVHEGVIVPHDFPYLESKAKLLKKLGAYTEFRFPAANCHVHGPGLISCGDGEKKQFGDSTLQALNFYTGKVHESTMGLELDSWKVTLSIWSPDVSPMMDMTMVYGDGECKYSGF